MKPHPHPRSKIENSSDDDAPPTAPLLVIIPLSSYMFGSRYILHDFHIKLIQQYIGESLSGRLGDNLVWDRWKRDRFSDVTDRRWFRVTGWTLVHPTRLAFEGVAALALAAALASAVYQWRVNPMAWAIILGFALMWILGASAAFVLHRAFDDLRLRHLQLQRAATGLTRTLNAI